MKTYSSAGLARMLDVNESTVKRWADSGYIECVKTKGGHRRFSTSAVMKFVHENKHALSELGDTIVMNPDLRAHVAAGNIDRLAPRLKVAALAGHEMEALSILRTAMAAKPDLLALFETVVFPPLREIGTEWETGKISVDIEHLASQTIRNALTRLQSEIHYEPFHGLTAVCCCYEEELHDIALLCASMYLASRGWKILYLGQMTPTQSLLNVIRRQKPNLVVLCAVVVNNPGRVVRDVNKLIHPLMQKVGGNLVIGGPNLVSIFKNRLKADFVVESILDLQRIADPAMFTQKKVNRR